MIEKLIHIKSMGKFADWSASEDLKFRKLTLVYGENGQGKSTLTAILRSLSTNDPAIVRERGKLSSTDPISILLRAQGTNHKFKDGTWNAPCKELLVFDSHFVERNVFSGEHIDANHRRNLFQVVLGEDAVALVETKAAIDSEIKAVSKSIREKGTAIDGHRPSSVARDRFIALVKKEGIGTKIQVAKKRVAAITESTTIASLQVPLTVTYDLPDTEDIKKSLSMTMESISQQAIVAVEAHLAKCMDDRGEKWIEQGRGYIVDDNCPFCRQSLCGLELVDAYKEYFSEAYGSHCVEILQLGTKVRENTSDSPLLELRKTVDTNSTAIGKWRKYLSEIKEPILDADLVEANIKKARVPLNHALDSKSAAPLLVITDTSKLASSAQELGDVASLIADYNNDVETFRTAVEALRKDAAQGDQNTAQADLDLLEGSVTRYKPEVVKLITEYETLRRDKKYLEAKKAKAVEDLDQKSSKAIGKYHKSINRTLERFGVEFRIANFRKDYVGQTPNAKHELQIDGHEVSMEDSVPGAPSFRCTLSAGDKTTLAFGFFLSMLEQRDLSNLIIVIDDPISSLNYFREAHTCSAIIDVLYKAEQVVVFSHHPEFLCKLWKNYRKNEVKTLEVYRSGQDSAIRNWKIENVARTAYQQHWWALKEYTENSALGSLEDIARCIRPLLEDYLRFNIVVGFEENDWLGDQIRKIREAPEGSELARGQPLVPELKDINDFTAPFHHGTNGRLAPAPKLLDTALRPMVQRTLTLIGAAIIAPMTTATA